MLEKIEKTIQYIRHKTNFIPRVGLTLGSGLGHFANNLDVCEIFDFSELPGFESPSIEGHSGKLIFGTIGNTKVALLKGRMHYYEGHSMQQVMFPTRVLGLLGCEIFVITNAAGGLRADITPGTFMIIRDHINFTGENPLRGPNEALLGARFPDMSKPYDKKLSDILEKILKEKNIPYFNGTYFCVSGPTYETPAEVKMFGQLGGGAVGMSTVPEVIAANHMGKKVVGISCITNFGAGLSEERLTHDDVKLVGAQVEKQFSEFLVQFIRDL